MKRPYQPTTSEQNNKRELEKIAARGIIERALIGERFGQHPGYAEIRLKLFTYVAQTQQEVRLPGLQLDLLASTPAEVEELVDVIERAVHLWVNGRWDRTVRRFQGEDSDVE